MATAERTIPDGHVYIFYDITVESKCMKSHNDFIKQLYNQANASVYTLHT
jgi:hypothetical protein